MVADHRVKPGALRASTPVAEKRCLQREVNHRPLVCANAYRGSHSMAKCTWTGKSGKKYEYEIYAMDTSWNDVAGNYIFAKESSPARWQALYIGQTESFADRLPNHEALPCVRRNGGTHVHAHTNQDKQARLAEEKDLLASNNPPCND